MSIVDKIDSFFEKRSQSEQTVLIFGVFLLIMFLSYEYLTPMSEEYLRKNRARKESIQKKINEDKQFLQRYTRNGDPEYYIKELQRKIEAQKRKYAALDDKYRYLVFKIKELSYLLYNKQRWAQFLDSITKKAHASNVDIDYISNTFLDTTKEFGHVLEIEVGCNGEYKNLISFIDAIEQSDLVVDVYELKMEGANPTQLQFKVSVWGISL
jgi:lipopolysaccharide export LptBFGC system permease protein LptF